MKGFISLHRRILEWEWYDDISCRVLFIHCLLKANFKDTRYKGVLVERGSFVTSLPILAEECGLSLQQTRTALSKLKSTCELTHTGTRKGSIVSVCKYETYQDSDFASNMQSNMQNNTQSTRNQHVEQHASNMKATCNQHVNNKENNKNNENKENNSLCNSANSTAQSFQLENESIRDLESEVARVWKHYPEKKGKARAVKSIAKHLKKFSAQDLIRFTNRYLAENAKTGYNLQNGSTFFHERILDYTDENFTPSTVSQEPSSSSLQIEICPITGEKTLGGRPYDISESKPLTPEQIEKRRRERKKEEEEFGF